MGLTPDKKKTAVVGVALTLFGLTVLTYGTTIFPEANMGGHLFSSMLLIIFGVLLVITSIMVFVLPATVDYLHEAFNEDDI